MGCVEEGTDEDPAAVIGEMAHIEASSDDGPRPNPCLSDCERDSYDNLILLCRNHHRIVDSLPSTYTDEVLRGWKLAMEENIREALTQEVTRITFSELDVVVRGLVNRGTPSSTSISIVPLKEKMNRNGLTEATEALFNIGLLQVRQVQQFVEAMSGLDANFVARLTSGFVEEYKKLRTQGLEGDLLFNAMRVFSAQWKSDLRQQSAGLAVLVYLFERCEVFER